MTTENRRLPSRKQRRKHLQHPVLNTRRIVVRSDSGEVIGTHIRVTSKPHTTRPEDRAFPEQQDYKPKKVRFISHKLQWLRKSIVERREAFGCRTAAEIKLSGVNYKPIRKKKKSVSQE